MSVEYRKLGRCGLRVSVPIVGAMSFGSKEWRPWVIEEEETFKILKAAWDKGINTIDTANVYSNGFSEAIIGKFLAKYEIPRHEVVILTKCFGVVGKTPDLPTWGNNATLFKQRDYVNQGGLSRAAIFNAVEASLKRLNTSYIDVLQIHRYDQDVEPEETMKALHDLVQSGKVRYLGASSMRCWQFAHLNQIAERNGWTKFVCMQDEYSLLYREDEHELHAYCKFHGIGIIPWAPLGAGTLARPVGANSTTRSDYVRGTAMDRRLSQSDEVIINRVEELSKKYGRKMSQIALAWTAKKITSPIVGLSSTDRLEESLIGGFELTDEDVKYLEEPYEPRPIRGHA
ncbi:hypothetical protein AX16_006821 [Volvariella volvacea WC 439]|nr:hypothetical protein AX16_006821 [Volvariella volvacea WC 439]